MFNTSSQKCNRCKHRFDCLLDKFNPFEHLVQFFMKRANSVRITQAHSGTYLTIKSVTYEVNHDLSGTFPAKYLVIKERIGHLNITQLKFRHRCLYIGRKFKNTLHSSRVLRNLCGNEPLDLIVCYIKFVAFIIDHPICLDGELISVISNLTNINWKDYFVLVDKSGTTYSLLK